MDLVKNLFQIENKTILIDYDLFFNNENKKYCHFVIDDIDEEKELKSIVKELKNKDETLSIYVCIYSELYDSKGNFSIYGDSLWLKTKLSIELDRLQ